MPSLSFSIQCGDDGDQYQYQCEILHSPYEASEERSHPNFFEGVCGQEEILKQPMKQVQGMVQNDDWGLGLKCNSIWSHPLEVKK